MDDEPAVRVSLRYIINSIEGFRCCREYPSGQAALAGIPRSEARVVFMDLQMPGMSGVECTRRLLRLVPALRVIIVTGLEDPDLLQHCLRVGAVHFLIKPVSLSSCRAALRLLCDLGALSGPSPPMADRLGAGQTQLPRLTITNEEWSILDCLVSGLAYKEIEDRLGITSSRLKHIQHRLFIKLQAKNQAQAARAWFHLRWQVGCDPSGMGEYI